MAKVNTTQYSRITRWWCRYHRLYTTHNPCCVRAVEFERR